MTIAVAGITLLASLSGIWLNSRIHRRHRARQAQLEAYRSLIAASEVLAVRVAGRKDRFSLRTTVLSSVFGSGRFLLILLFAALNRRWRAFKLAELIALVETLPLTDDDFTRQLSATSLWEALEELQAARIRIKLVGTETAQAAAERVVEAAIAVVQTASQATIFPWSERMNRRLLADRRSVLKIAHDSFVVEVRREQRKFR